MPIPKVKSNESKQEYISRCMSNETMVKEYEQSQRSAICYQQWRDRNDVGDSMDRELRVDEGEIKDWRYDEDEEVLVADVLMTKSQVLPYKEDKETIWELLPPDELSKENWLNSSKSKAVTDLHPNEEVNYDNLGDLSKGSLTNDIWTEEKDDGTVEVWAKETVYDSDLIQDIKDGKKEQVSIGRFVEIVDESGEFNGATFDRKQTNFELNHLAHVPQGRAGSDVSVRLDGDDTMVSLKEDEKWSTAYINDLPDSSFAVIEPAYKSGDTDNKNARHLPHHGPGGGGTKDTNLDLPHLRNALARANQIKPITDSISTSELRSKAESHLEHHRDALEGDSKPDEIATSDEVRDMKLTLGDKELELDDELTEDTIVEFQDEIDERLHELRDKDNELDSKDERLGKLDGRIQSLEDKADKNVTEDKINEKLALIEDVKEVMPDYDWKGKSSIEMKTDVIDAVFDGVDLEDKSEAYVNGRFDSAIEKAKDEQGKKMAIKPDRKDDEAQSEIEELRKKRVEKFQG